MKIILEIPDTTVCAFFDFIRYNEHFTGMAMQRGHINEWNDSDFHFMYFFRRKYYDNILQRI